MKKLQLILLSCLLGAASAMASSFMTVTESDTLRILPTQFEKYEILPVICNFDGVCDHWRFQIDHPVQFRINDFYPKSSIDDGGYLNYGVSVPYLQYDGTEAIYKADILQIKDEQVISANIRRSLYESSITQHGYWDSNNDGIYESYGTVKWGPGRVERMFDIHFFLDSDCTGDSIVISAMMTCTTDWRYPAINYTYNKVIHLVVSYQVGDVNGDDKVDISDVTALINLLVTGGVDNLDEYQRDAADVNRDGNINISDVTALINRLQKAGNNVTALIDDLDLTDGAIE